MSYKDGDYEWEKTTFSQLRPGDIFTGNPPYGTILECLTHRWLNGEVVLTYKCLAHPRENRSYLIEVGEERQRAYDPEGPTNRNVRPLLSVSAERQAAARQALRELT